MKERVVCPTCGQQYRVSPELVGRKAKCKKCGQAFEVKGALPVSFKEAPVSEEAPTIKCPFCAEEILPQAKKCRFCGEWLTGLPSDGTQPATASAVKRGIMMEKKRAQLREGGYTIASILALGSGIGVWKFTGSWKLAVAVGLAVALAIAAAVEHSYWKGLRDDDEPRK